MKKTIGIIRGLLIVLAMVPQFLMSGAQAHNTLEFTTQGTTNSASVNGQIDWPQGKLAAWKGPIIVFISSGVPTDRDGWTVLARRTVWNRRSPYKDLSDALVSKGMAVVRFDHPAVRKPASNCRESLENLYNENTIEKRCLNVQVLARTSVNTYVNGIENLIDNVIRRAPAAKHRLVLFGFSEGLQHAATILNRRNITPSAMISIGSPAQCLRRIARWQAVERVVETLPEFDSNSDGIVTNNEITDGYGRGIGQIALTVDVWLSPAGKWEKPDINDFRINLERQYIELTAQLSNPGEKDSMTYIRDKSGVLVPDVTKSFWRMHFHSSVSPLESMVKLGVRGLFIWGEVDRQIPISQQADLISAAKERGAAVDFVRFPGRFHMLSAKTDTDWFEAALAADIAGMVSEFLEKPQ